MPYYISDNDVLLAASQKVMSSSLNRTTGIRRVGRLELIMFLVLRKLRRKESRNVVLVRDPVARALSVYNQKFKYFSRYYRDKKLENIHLLCLEHLNITKESVFDQIHKKFELLTLKEWIDILEKMYWKDGHTAFQSDLRKLSIKGFHFFSINFNQLFSMESKEDLDALQQLLNVSFVKINVGQQKNISSVDSYTVDRIKIIYEKDYLFILENSRKS